MDPDALPPPYSSLFQCQYNQNLTTPLVSPTTSYPMPIPMPHAIYSMPMERREDVKPEPKFGFNPPYASPLLRDPEVPIVSVTARSARDETADIPPQRRSLMSNSKKCCVIVVALVLCGVWAVMSMNLYSRHRASHTF